MHDMFWVGMIQAQGARCPGAANMRNVARDIIYDSLIRQAAGGRRMRRPYAKIFAIPKI